MIKIAEYIISCLPLIEIFKPTTKLSSQGRLQKTFINPMLYEYKTTSTNKNCNHQNIKNENTQQISHKT